LESPDSQGKNQGTLPKDVIPMLLVFKYLLTMINLLIKSFYNFLSFLLNLSVTNIYVGKNPEYIPDGSIVFFPFQANTLNCGLAGIVALKLKETSQISIDANKFDQMVDKIISTPFDLCQQNSLSLSEYYLGGKNHMDQLLAMGRTWKVSNGFYQIYKSHDIQKKISNTASRLAEMIDLEKKRLSDHMGYLEAEDVEIMAGRIEKAKDIAWLLQWEILGNVEKVRNLMSNQDKDPGADRLKLYRMINSILNSLDRLEVRGRDSAGISLMFILDDSEYEKFENALSNLNKSATLLDQFRQRIGKDVLLNQDISTRQTKNYSGVSQTGLTFTYKVAAEIGSLGNNVAFLRNHITNDAVLHLLTTFPHLHHTVSAHTRWASVGAITEANCHPVDNKCIITATQEAGIIHACLNGDIDNYHELKAEYERNGGKIHEDITTDTKIIPIQVEKYIQNGYSAQEAFRMAVNDFQGSHAISIHTDIAPGKIFLAQKGSGQAVFVGLAEDHYMPASEIYGFVEETQTYIKLDGEKTVDGKKVRDHGQIFIIDRDSKGGLDGICAMFYDGSPIRLTPEDIKHTEITSRDIDRQNFPHYFLKEISEAPNSVEKTLLNRWKISHDNDTNYKVVLDERVFPEDIKSAFVENRIRRIFVIGQGTAGIAATACCDIIDHYLNDPRIQISAMKASELSGFKLPASNGTETMADTLVIAISQSGTTTDTNRTVDMVRERGAKTIAIVNRRDSDITFKVDGIMYTSNGRDLEMSVASTKAFYSQIIAGALLGLFMAGLKKRRPPEFINQEIRQLLEIPGHMRKVLAMKDKIRESAKRLAVTKNYWAVVGSGPNKASSDEIRIKLSELCYKTISTDCVEDKKHIDLSSEPLILVCAAGTGDSVIGDLIKDTAIFKAHKASPVVIANEGENRFEANAEDVFYVPRVSEHLAPILNTLVGHLWGYYAALSINDVSKFLDGFRENIRKTIEDFSEKKMDLYEVILEKSFREKIGKFNREFRAQMADNRFPPGMGLKAASDLSLLLKYLSGRLPLTDFEIDFGVKGTPSNMITQFYECIGDAINAMIRPVDAIKHQAKTVTVGTSRITERIETGILFDALAAHKFTLAQLTPNNFVVLRNVQEIISSIKGAILYRIKGLDLLGEATDKTTIEIIKKEGVLQPIPSRVENDKLLKGTKRIIVEEKNVYIGKGRKDNRSIVVTPITSSSPAKTNVIEYLLLLNVSFKDNVPLASKIKALGGKYERIKNIVQENSVSWKDELIELVDMRELFGSSAEKIGEYIVSHQKLAGIK
jgi:glutamine---fructose-6-phosphate transaminase (isomerizing)